MERPPRHAPKKLDPEFISLSPKKRSRELPQRRSSITKPRTPVDNKVGARGRRASGASLRRQSVEKNRHENVKRKPEVKKTPKVQEVRTESRESQVLKEVTDKVDDAIAGTSSNADFKFAGGDVTSDNAPAEADADEQWNDITMETAVDDEDDDEVTLNFSRTADDSVLDSELSGKEPSRVSLEISSADNIGSNRKETDSTESKTKEQSKVERPAVDDSDAELTLRGEANDGPSDEQISEDAANNNDTTQVSRQSVGSYKFSRSSELSALGIDVSLSLSSELSALTCDVNCVKNLQTELGEGCSNINSGVGVENCNQNVLQSDNVNVENVAQDSDGGVKRFKGGEKMQEIVSETAAGPSGMLRKKRSVSTHQNMIWNMFAINMNPVIKLQQLKPGQYKHLPSGKKKGEGSPLKDLANEKARRDGSKVKIMLKRCDGFMEKKMAAKVGKNIDENKVEQKLKNGTDCEVELNDIVTNKTEQRDKTIEVERGNKGIVEPEVEPDDTRIAEISFHRNGKDLAENEGKQNDKDILTTKVEEREITEAPPREDVTENVEDDVTPKTQKPKTTPRKRRRHHDVFSSYLRNKFSVKRRLTQAAGRGREQNVQSVSKVKVKKVITADVKPIGLVARRVSPRKRKRSDVFAAYLKQRRRNKRSGIVRKIKRRESSDTGEGVGDPQGSLNGEDLLKKIKEEVDDQGLYGDVNGLGNSSAAEQTVAMDTECHVGEIGQIILAPVVCFPPVAESSLVEQPRKDLMSGSSCSRIDNVRGASCEFSDQNGQYSLNLQSADVTMDTSKDESNVLELSYEDFLAQDVSPGAKSDKSGAKLKKKNKDSPPKRRSRIVDVKKILKSPPVGRKRKRDVTPSSASKRRRRSGPGRPPKHAKGSPAKVKDKKVLKHHERLKKAKGWDKLPSKIRCKKFGCPQETVKCVASIIDGCDGQGRSARWYHISRGEHYCNKCFEYVYRQNKVCEVTHQAYLDWKVRWTKNSDREGNVRIYMIDQMIPFWAQCSKCQKWREIPKGVKVSAKFNKNFTCQKIFKGKRVKHVREPDWFVDSNAILILTESAAAPFLVNYPPDDVGLSAFTFKRPKKISSNNESEMKMFENDDNSDVDSDFYEELQDPNVEGVSDFLRPFHIPGGVLRAGTTEADKMSKDEKNAFPHHCKHPASYKVYITLRNLILSLWNLNVREWLTKDTCAHHLICRGLIRIHCIDLLEEILSYLTVKGLINYGLIKPPQQLRVISAAAKKEHVLVIGAGPAGLSVAHQLHRFGIKVTVLEAQSRIGGRVWDDNFAGAVIGRGAQLLNGCMNNPFAVMCQQLNIQPRHMKENCLLLTESGKVVSPAIDSKIDFHFDEMLENVAEWRNRVSLNEDISLLEKLEEVHSDFVSESGITFTEEEEALILFHYSNLEYALGQDLSQISALNWDHNEVFSQFCGPHVIMDQGYSSILKKLAEKLDVKLNVCVEEINYSGSKVKVVANQGEVVEGSKVVVTVPLKVLQSNIIGFSPPLPKVKQRAIQCIGAGTVEKVAMAFPYRFWANKVQDADYFGHVPSCSKERGLFSVFYDLTPKSNEPGENVLVTFISGKAMSLVKHKNDESIVEMCLEKLRKMFPEEKIPTPTKSFVTHWIQDPYAGMAYSYLSVGTSADLYDVLSEEIDDKIFFAGEATNRQFPQSVTGAYLSGVREAEKILHCLAS